MGFHSHPGPALRLSQPLSGLLANPSSTALLHAAAARGLPLLVETRSSQGSCGRDRQLRRRPFTDEREIALPPPASSRLRNFFPLVRSTPFASCPARAPKAPVRSPFQYDSSQASEPSTHPIPRDQVRAFAHAPARDLTDPETLSTKALSLAIKRPDLVSPVTLEAR